jgi:hypothetical protein
MKKMSKILLVSLLLFIGIAACSVKQTNPFDSLKRVTFLQLDEMIANHDTVVVYFGWTKNCGDARNIQNNYFKEALTANPEWKTKIVVVDLDNEIPAALTNIPFRKPMSDLYGVKHSPTLVYYVSGVKTKMIEWTPTTADSTYGIPLPQIVDFFTSIGYLKKA